MVILFWKFKPSVLNLIKFIIKENLSRQKIESNLLWIELKITQGQWEYLCNVDSWQEISHVNWDEESPDYLQHTANISSAKSTTFHCAFARQPSFTGKLYIERNSFLYGAHILIIGKKYPTLIGMKNLLIIFSTLQIFQLPKIQPFNVSLVGNPSLKGDLSFAERMA